MAALPQQFFDQLVAESCQIIGLEDASKILKDTDPVVKLCARSAYSQGKKFCKRPFHKGERVDFYSEYYGPLELRSLPLCINPQDVNQSLLLAVSVDGTALATTDFSILPDGRLCLYGKDDDTSAPQYEKILVTSTTGYEKVEENDTLYTGLLLQTLANYHRKDSLGLKEVTGQHGIARFPADSGEMIESAKQVLEGLVYHGQGCAVGLGD